MNREMKAGEQCFRVIREFEKAPPDCRQTSDGAALDAYICPSGQPTLWFGCCFWSDGRLVKMGETIEPGPEAEAMMAYNIRYCEEYVRQHVTVELTQYQFDALCSFRFNTRETTLRNSSRLLPAINAREWQKAAAAFTEFVYGTTAYEGKPYQRAMRGLLRRRLWEGLIFLGLDPAEAVKPDDVALPCDRRLMSSGVWRDMIRSEGLTTLNQVKMKARPLPPLSEPADSVLFDAAPTPAPVPKPAQAAIPDTPEPPVRAGGEAGTPKASVKPPSPTKPSASPAPTPTPSGGTSSPPPIPAAAGGSNLPPQPVPLPKPKEPEKPIAAPPLPKDAPPTNAADPKDLVLSKRFWGLFITGIGTTNFLPRAVQEWINNEGNRELLTMLLVVVIGVVLFKIGQATAKRPLK